jgi:hypothetical protein
MVMRLGRFVGLAKAAREAIAIKAGSFIISQESEHAEGPFIPLDLWTFIARNCSRLGRLR